VVAELGPDRGFDGEVTSTIPIGSGLSSSAAQELAVALALGIDGPPEALARLGQRAEQRASGVPCGLMDQLASAVGLEGHALLMDFTSGSVEAIPLPSGVDVVVVHSGQHRALATSGYAERRAACERAAAIIGPLRDIAVIRAGAGAGAGAGTDALGAIDDPVVRRRARHVITENARVGAFAEALAARDLAAAGQLMVESHASLRDDFEVSTPALDALVERLIATPGVHGARLTGAGFGGCVVALTDPETLDEGWTVRPSGGARRLDP
jgi:galactokinase